MHALSAIMSISQKYFMLLWQLSTLSTDYKILTGYVNRELVKLIENRQYLVKQLFRVQVRGLGGSGQQGRGNTISDNHFFKIYSPQ